MGQGRGFKIAGVRPELREDWMRDTIKIPSRYLQNFRGELKILTELSSVKMRSISRINPDGACYRRRNRGLNCKVEMSQRGVWQLQKLIVNYCDWGGSSCGIRSFMESYLPTFKDCNPQLEVVTAVIRGQHPHLKGLYKNNNERVVCVKNLSPDDVLLQAQECIGEKGGKA